MSTAEKRRYTVEEYLAMERASELKHEYYQSEVFEMAGASIPHNHVTNNLSSHLRFGLREKGCQVFQSDLRVKASSTGLYTYPDVVVVCGEMEVEDEQLDTLLNPTVLIEVLSPSTENYDRSIKFRHFHTIKSLKEYALVQQDRYYIEVYTRQGDESWLLNIYQGAEGVLHFLALDFALPFAEVYYDVSIPDSDPLSPLHDSDAS